MVILYMIVLYLQISYKDTNIFSLNRKIVEKSFGLYQQLFLKSFF